MQIRYSFLLVLIFLLFSCSQSSQTQTTESTTKSSPSQAENSAEEWVKKLMEEQHIPGMAVSVSKENKLIWSQGYGFADLEQQIPVDASKTKFRIGSVSKSLTAAAMMRLFQDGKLDLDAPIQTYVPSFPKKEKGEINLRLLGGHLAGIRHYKGNEFLSDKHYPTVLEGLDIFKDDPLISVPGSKYSYSSYGWNLISAAIETASEKEFLPYVNEVVFTPLEMTNTEADFATKEIENRTNFYEVTNAGKVVDAPFVDNSYKWAGGGFIGTSEDLVKFGNALLGDEYLNQTSKDEFITSQKTTDGKLTNYGIGWRTKVDDFGRTWFGHTGGSVGGITYFGVFPEEKMVIALVSNSSDVSYGDLAFRIVNELAK